jgi:hypothetical protein
MNGMGKIMSNDIKLHNTIRDVMCSRCGISVKVDCFQQCENVRYTQMCICIKKILVPNDEKYPTTDWVERAKRSD